MLEHPALELSPPGFAYKKERSPFIMVLINIIPVPVILYIRALSQSNDLLHFIHFHTPPRAHRSWCARM